PSTGSRLVLNPRPRHPRLTTPANRLKNTRGLTAPVRAYQASPNAPGVNCVACWDSVLTALAASFVDPAASMDLGVYNLFSTGNEDASNALSQDPASAVNLAHPFIKDSVENQVGGSPDKRYLAKVTTRGGGVFSLACLSSGLSWTRYPTPNSSIPVIRNEELILLRAEAEWFAAVPNKAQAVADLNTIRQTSGGLTPTTLTVGSTNAAFVNELLKQRLYSLLFEGGHRWIDMRRQGRLNQVINDRPTGCPAAGIPKDTVFSTMPINIFEVQARQ